MKKTLVYYLYFLLIFLSIFVDNRLQVKYGYFGRSILNFTIPIFFLILCFLTGKITINTFIKKNLYLEIYLLLIGLVTSFAWMLIKKNCVLYGENIYIKSIKVSFYWLLICLYMSCIYICTRNLTLKQIFKPFVYTYYFLFGYLLLELSTMPRAFHIGYGQGLYYERIRLTTTESSTTTPLIIIFAIATLYYFYNVKKNRVMLSITGITGAIFVVTSGSKSLYLILAIGSLFLLPNILRKIPRKQFVFIIIISGILLMIGGWYGGKILSLTDRYRGSFGIRGTQIVAGIIHAICYPFGVGGGVAMYTLRSLSTWLFQKINSIQSLSYYIISNWEVNELMYGTTDQAASIIAGMVNESCYWGWVGTAYWLNTVYRYIGWLRKREGLDMLLLKFFCFAFLFMVFATLTITNYYSMWAMLIIVGEIGCHRKWKENL